MAFNVKYIKCEKFRTGKISDEKGFAEKISNISSVRNFFRTKISHLMYVLTNILHVVHLERNLYICIVLVRYSKCFTIFLPFYNYTRQFEYRLTRTFVTSRPFCPFALDRVTVIALCAGWNEIYKNVSYLFESN